MTKPKELLIGIGEKAIVPHGALVVYFGLDTLKVVNVVLHEIFV